MVMMICLLYDGKEPIFLGYLIKNNNRAVFVEKKVVLQGTKAFDEPLKGCQREVGRPWGTMSGCCKLNFMPIRVEVRLQSMRTR